MTSPEGGRKATAAAIISRWGAPLFLTVAALAFHRQLLVPDGFRSSDHADFYLRVNQYEQEFSAGRWPQLLPDAIRGGGHAFPMFYPPWSHVVAAGVDRLTRNVIAATHLSALFGVALSALAQYLLIVRCTRSRLAGLVGALAYAAFPYRHVQLGIRGAFAESWAMVWYPLILLGAVHAWDRGRPPRWWPFAIAGLVLTHTALALWSIPLLLVLGIVATPAQAQRFSLAKASAVAAALAIGVSAFYLVPVAAALSTVRAALPTVMWTLPSDLAKSSREFTLPFFTNALLVPLLGMVPLTGYGLWVSMRGGDARQRLLWAAIAAMLLLLGFLAAPEPVWRLIPAPFRFIQFPLRLLGPAGFLGSLALGLSAAGARGVAARSTWIVVLGLAGLAGWQTGGAAMLPRGLSADAVLRLLDTDYPDRGLTIAGDYLPKEADPDDLSSLVQQTRDSVGLAPLLRWDHSDAVYRATIVATREMVVRLPLVAYPIYRVTVAGSSLPTGNRRGQLTVTLGAGRHEVVLRRQPTQTQWWGMALSLLMTLAALLVRHTGARTTGS
jgi:hypothetical protein